VHPQTPGAPQQPADLTRYLAMQSGMSAPEFTAPVGSLSALRPDLFKHAFAQEQMLTDGQMGVPSQAVPAAAPATPPTPKPTDPTNPGFSTGTSRVPGKGSPKVDSVKANLAPDEAVLNAGAADHLGRPVIDALNAIGMAKMGMVPASTMDDRAQVQQAAQTAKGPDSSSTKDDRAQNPGFAKGTAKVGKGMPAGKAPDISQVDPRLLAAALQMGQGGAQGAPAGPPQGAGMM
jgi:hypothetical protein